MNVRQRTDTAAVARDTGTSESQQHKEDTMLGTLAIILLILWALGMVTAYTMGGFIHILLVVAVVMVLVRVIQGRSPL